MPAFIFRAWCVKTVPLSNHWSRVTQMCAIGLDLHWLRYWPGTKPLFEAVMTCSLPHSLEVPCARLGTGTELTTIRAHLPYPVSILSTCSRTLPISNHIKSRMINFSVRLTKGEQSKLSCIMYKVLRKNPIYVVILIGLLQYRYHWQNYVCMTPGCLMGMVLLQIISKKLLNEEHGTYSFKNGMKIKIIIITVKHTI